MQQLIRRLIKPLVKPFIWPLFTPLVRPRTKPAVTPRTDRSTMRTLRHTVPATFLSDRHPVQLKPAALTALTRQLAALLAADIPLLIALDLLARDDGAPAQRRLLLAVREQVGQGDSLSAVMARYPRVFDTFYLCMVTLGEASGRLADRLTRLAETRERRAGYRRQLQQALIYPIFVCIVAVVVVLGLMIWAVPSFQRLFDGFGAALPPLTRAVVLVSDLLVSHGIVLVVVAAGVTGASGLAMRHSPRFRHAAQMRRFTLPIVGPVFLHTALAQWASGVGILLQAGTPLIDALLTISQGRQVFDRAGRRMVEQLRRGESLAAAMTTAGCFPASAVRIVDIAEHAGSLDRMLIDLGERCAVEAQTRIVGLTRVVEPLVMTLCGGFVAIVVMALYLPIIELGNVV